MDIKQIITDNLPEGTELADKTLAAIAKDVKKAVGETFIPKEWYSKKTEEWDKEKRELGEKLAAYSDYDDVRKRYEAELAAHKKTREDYQAEKQAAEIDGLVSAALKGAGMNEKAIPKAIKLYDRAIAERDKDGCLKNADKVLEYFKGEWGDFFGEITQKQGDVGTPPKIDVPEKPNMTRVLFGIKN